jgi:hypothetical protein
VGGQKGGKGRVGSVEVKQGRQQEVIAAAAMEARRKEEEWVRDWRKHTTIRQNGDQNLHLEMMGGQW